MIHNEVRVDSNNILLQDILIVNSQCKGFSQFVKFTKIFSHENFLYGYTPVVGWLCIT